MKHVFLALSLTLVLALGATAQTEGFPQRPFNFNLAPISLPGVKQTVVGTDAGASFQITPNIEVRQENILATGNTNQGFFGGANYHFPWLSTKLQNASPYLNGYRFDFYATASLGVWRNTQANTQHWAQIVGGGASYAVTSGGGFTFGAEVGMLNAPGFARWVPIVKMGPEVSFGH